MRASSLAVALLALSVLPASAQEPRGCDKFKWPIGAGQAALTATERQSASGDSYDRTSTAAIEMPLAPLAEAKLAMPPERAPKKSDSSAGAVAFAAVENAGRYRVALSAAGWIDIIQDGKYLTPTAFTGALDCQGVRKSVEFDLGAAGFTLQVSDVSDPKMLVVLTPAP
jgi:hypothetical protein